MGTNQRTISDIQTICPSCMQPLTGHYVSHEGAVFLECECDACGSFSELASEYDEDFVKWMAYPTLTVPPKQSLTKSDKGCPLDCGTCENHLMTACCVLLDVTERCNQHCPWCFASSDDSDIVLDSPLSKVDKLNDPSLEEIVKAYDRLIELGEERPFNIQLSGGEPTVREDLEDIIRIGREKGFEYIQLNTNGRKLGEDAGYAKELAEAGLTTVFLQFDGMNDDIYIKLRNEPLLEIKKRAVENCAAAGLPVTLVPTVVKNVNLTNIGDIFAYMKDNVHVVKGIHFQPASFFGRRPDGEGESETNRLTMFALMLEIERQTNSAIKREDLIPISTGHPLCCFCSTFLIEKDGSIASLITDEQRQNGSSCCCSEASDPLDIIKRDRNFVLNKWAVSSKSESANKDADSNKDTVSNKDAASNKNAASNVDAASSMEAQDGIMSLDEAANWIRSHMFTISGMAFMDRTNLDAERLKRCRVQYYTKDDRLIPFCAYNSIYRNSDIRAQK